MKTRCTRDWGKFKFTKDTHCETGRENKREGRELDRRGEEMPVPAKLYQKTI